MKDNYDNQGMTLKDELILLSEKYRLLLSRLEVEDVKNERLKIKNDRLLKCVEFYADEENWQWTNQNSRILMKFDINFNEQMSHRFGGKLARQTLSEIKENRK